MLPFAGPRLDDASLAVQGILTAGIIPLALEMMDQGATRCVEEYLHIGLPVEAEEVLLVEVDGELQAVAGQIRSVAEIYVRPSPAAVDAMRRIKSALDPNGILNPAKIFPQSKKPLF